MADANNYKTAREQLNKKPSWLEEHKESIALERKITVFRTSQIERNPIEGNYDLAHLKKVHQRLFEHLYEYAGKLRPVTETWFKRLDRHYRSDFAHINDAVNIISETAKQLKQKNYLKGLEKSDFVEQFTKIYAQYNNAHPFEEGNGRALRVMTAQLARNAGFKFSMENIETNEWDFASLKSGAHYRIYEGGFVKIPQEPDLTLLHEIMDKAITPIATKSM